MSDQQFLLKREFFEQAIQTRIYTSQLAELAARLAAAAGDDAPAAAAPAAGDAESGDGGEA